MEGENKIVRHALAQLDQAQQEEQPGHYIWAEVVQVGDLSRAGWLGGGLGSGAGLTRYCLLLQWKVHCGPSSIPRNLVVPYIELCTDAKIVPDVALGPEVNLVAGKHTWRRDEWTWRTEWRSRGG